MASRRLSLSQAKNRKQKKLVAVLSVVFVILAAVQAPKTLKLLDAKPPPEAPLAAQPTAAGVPGTSAPGAAQSVTAHLRDFSSLALKDPFLTQVPLGTLTTASPVAAQPAAPVAKAAPPVKFVIKAPPPNAAVLKTNGKRQTVYIGDGFPNSGPVFKLVALTGQNGVRLGVLGGSFTGGVATIKLAEGKHVTLANTADGANYVIELVKLTNAQEPVPTQPTQTQVQPATQTPSQSATPSTATQQSTGTPAAIPLSPK